MPINTKKAFRDFTNRLKILIQKRPDLITVALGNIFTMRLIGNKTHGDLAEIGIMEFVNQYMDDFQAKHVGKELYRAKTQEEDIVVTNKKTNKEFPISLKAYGIGSLQLSTDKESLMFQQLEKSGKQIIKGKSVGKILADPAFTMFYQINVLALIYSEKKMQGNIMEFDLQKASRSVVKIMKEEYGKKRKYPCYRFYDKQEQYICEVRYGGASANALQRGLWTHSKNASKYFKSITGGWIGYEHNLTIIQLFSHALITEQKVHKQTLKNLEKNIILLKNKEVR